MDPTANKHGLDELDDDISFFKNISSQVVSTPHVNSASMRKFEHTPLNGLTLSMLLSPSIHHNVTYSNLNTEEKKIFLPSEHAKSVNITKGDSSDLFDKSSDCKQPSVLKKFNSPLLFDTEQNTSVPIRRPVTGSSTKNENSVVKMIHSNGSLETNLNENKANEVKSTDEDVMATEFSKVLEYSGSNCKLKESTMNHKSKTNPCKVLFEADNSRDCFLQKEDLVDSPITITNVTPLYEKLKSSLNNSKKSNNETKIDNLVVNYLEEVIEFKSEDKTAPKSERTPTRNKPVSMQVIPRSLNFVNEKSKHLSDRSKSPSLDDFFHVEKVDGDVFDILEATNSEDNDDIVQSSQTKEKKSDKVKFIYPSDLLKVKKRNLNHEVGKLNFNKDLIFELEAMKEMSDVKEFSTENHKKKTIPSRDTTSTNRLMSFSEVLMNSQESCVLNKSEKRMMSENTQFPNTQIDTIFKNLELDRPVVSTKCSKPATTLFSAGPEVQKITEVPMNTVYDETKSDFHVADLDPFFGFSENERLHLLYKKDELMLILSNMSNHSKQEKFEIFQNNLNVSEVETETNDEFNNTKIVTINFKGNNEVTSSVSLISQSISKKPEFSSFKCASGKNININSNTLLKSKLLFASFDEELKGDIEMFSNWIPNRISDKKSNIKSFSNTLRNTNTSEVCNIKVPFEKIGKSSIVNSIHTEPAILKNRCNTNGTQTCVKSSCLEFEDSFVIPQTQDMEQESRNKYEKEHNSREKPDEVNINDISNSQFHQLGELVDKQHKLSIKKELTYDQKNLLLQTNCNCPNETMKSVRPKSPDFSCSVQTASQNLIRQENALSSLLPRSMKQVGNKAASVSKLTWSKMSQRNSFDFLKLNKLSETIDKAVISGSLPMVLKNNKKSSIPQVGKSPSPDLSSNFGNMIEIRNKYCTLESLLCFDDNTLGPNNKLSTVSTNLRDIGKHASQFERVVDPLPAKDFQGFSCDTLVMAIRKFQFTTFHQIIDEFKGFSDQGITSKVKKQFILKHLLDSGSRTDNEHKVDHFQTLHEHQTNYFEVKTKENTGVFSSSSDEKTTVTAESLNKAKLHLDITDKNHFNLQIKEISTSSVLCKPAVGGLLYESGKKISLCEASLKKAKQLLEIVDENHTNDFKARSKSATGDFASPSVKKTTVAVDSLKKAKQILDSVDESITTNEKTKSAIGGFVSASGKKIIVSEESLKKAKQLLDDVDENITIDKKVEHKSAMGDFASASRKKITVSEESLKKAKQLLDDVDENITIDVKEEPKSAIRGFASASGKKITVSEESLKKAKQLLDDVDENITIDKKVETKSARGGFASASGKKITVSEDSLKKAKQLLDDVDENITIDKKVETKSAMGGFASASGKKITVSEGSLKKAKQLLDDVDENITIDKKRETKSAIRGFASASGKKITVSEESLKKAKQLLDDVDENITIDKKVETKSAMGGFASASGKKITVSEDSLKKAKQLLDDVDENITIDKKVETKSAMGGFASASGKKITVSEGSLKKAKQLLDDVDENITIDKKRETKSAIRGFASASGKKITVSEESLKKAKQLLDDVDENITIDKKVETKSAMGGFASASGKKITVSEDSLKKAKQLLDDVDENITIDKKVETKSAMGGFASASGKKITVSEGSLKKAKQLLDDVDENITIDKKRETKSAIRGFASASGKKITVSEESLKKAKQLLDDVDENITIEKKVETKSAMGDFASASGKKITVSEESLKKAKPLLDDVDENITIDVKLEPKSAIRGFASASGKKITVSEESLKKAKQLLDDVDENIDVKVELESAIRGFASASGKKITVSEESLKKAKQLLDDVDENISIDKKVEAKSAMGGFASASGKKITVSEESLKKAKQLLDNVNENITIDKKVETKSAIGGFASASGKKITVSEDSLKKAKQLLDNVDESITTNEKVETKSAIGGFASAIGKKITVSKDNLKKAKQLLIAVDESITTNEKVETKSAIGGFASASGKKIPASKNSLNKGKVLLDTADEDFNTKGKLETKSAIGGFASASPKKMTVSEECVKKEKLYLDTADHNLAAEGTVETKPAIAGFASESGKKRAVSEENLERSNQLLHRIEDSNNSQGLDKPILQSKSAVKNFVLPSREKKAKILLDKYAENNINTSVSQSMGIPRDMEGKRKLSSESPDLSSKFVSRLENVSINFMTELLAGETKSPESSFENMRKLNVPLSSTNKRRKLCFTQPGGKDLPTDCKLINGTANANVVSEKEKVFRAKVIAKREIALANQRKHIAECCRLNKKGQYHVTFQTGSFYRAKQMKEERISFTEMTKRKAPGLFTSAECIMSGIPETVLSMTLEQAGSFQFNLLESYDTNFLAVNTDGIVAGDNVRIIINQHDQVGLAQVQAGFLTSPHVNCCVVSDRWVENHYALLVWKFCSLERSYPDMFKGKICTLDNLLLQLKYRYDCEMENQISCLKKMIQCDDTPNKRIILVVSRVLRNIARVGNTSLNKSHPLEDIQLEMSDGWYCIRVQVDEEMKALVARQRVKVGTKLITCNAEMYNNDQGCDPLHIKPDIYLKLHTNCTRRAHWLSKLGYAAVPEPLVISLSSILARGGLVPQIKVVLARVYPMLYMERNTGRKAIIRSEKMENLAMMKFQKYYEKQLELIYTRLRSQNKTEEMKEAKKRPSLAKMSKAEIRAITSGEDLYNLVSTNFDSILNLLTNEQLSELEKYKMTVREQIATNVQQDLKQEVAGRSDLNRQVTSLLKMKICDVSNPDSTAMLTIWRPDPSILELLREGKCFRLQYVTSSGFRFGEIQLSTTKHTQFIPYSSDTDDASISRHVSLIGSPLVPRFGEVDAAGLVVHIAEVGNKTVVFLANEKSQFLAVDFWNGLKESGYEDILRVGSVVGCSNLQYRANAIAGLSFISDPSACNASSTENTMDLTQYIPSTCSTEHSVYTRNPRAKHLNSAHAELAARLKEMNLPAYITKCQSLIQTNPTQFRYTPSNSKLLNHSNLSNPSGLSRKRLSLLESGSSAKKLCTEANQSLSNSTTGGPDNHYTSINASSTSCNSLHPEKHEPPSILSSCNVTATDHTLSSSNVTATDLNESSNAQPVNSSVDSSTTITESTTETYRSLSSTSINLSSSSNNLIPHKQHIRGKSSDNLTKNASPSLSTPKRLPLGNQSCPPVNTSTPNPPGAHFHLAGKTSTPIGPSPFGAQFQSSFEDEGVVTPIQRKIRTLERYREPPPLTPGILSLRSKKLLKPFRVPRK